MNICTRKDHPNMSKKELRLTEQLVQQSTKVRTQLFDILENFLAVGDKTYRKEDTKELLETITVELQQIRDESNTLIHISDQLKGKVTEYDKYDITGALYEYASLNVDLRDSGITELKELGEKLTDDHNIIHDEANKAGLICY